MPRKRKVLTSVGILVSQSRVATLRFDQLLRLTLFLILHEFNCKIFQLQESMASSREDLPNNIANLFRASIEGNLMGVRRCIGKNMKYDPISHCHIKNEFDYLNSKDKYDFTPIHHAAKLGHFKVVEHLLFSGASVKSISKVGKTALHYAVEGGNFEIVILILQYNANVNAEDNWCLTPLHSACTYGHFEIAKYLCENGAEINVSTLTKKLTPLHYAGMK